MIPITITYIVLFNFIQFIYIFRNFNSFKPFKIIEKKIRILKFEIMKEYFKNALNLNPKIHNILIAEG